MIPQEPKIIQAAAKTIVGINVSMSLSDNKTSQLWQAFGPRRKEIPYAQDGGSYSIQEYTGNFSMQDFSPTTLFTKWAGVTVTQVPQVPKGMEVLEIPAGQWAVFTYRGRTSDFYNFAMYIYGRWLPQSGYELDARPHFEYMPPDYLGPNHPDAQEEVWIPIK